MKPSRASSLRIRLRRLWLVPVCVVIAAAIGYAVSERQSTHYTSSSVVLVTSVSGPVASGADSDATDLAATYRSGIPVDPRLRAFLTRMAHVSTANTITTLPAHGSVFTVRFAAASPVQALAGARAITNALTRSPPASSIVSAGTLRVVASPTTAKRLAGGRYQASIVFIVPSTPGPVEGINPDDAQHLATTYAAIMTSDDRLLDDVGRPIGEDSDTVESNLSVVNEQNTSLLRISFTATTPRHAAETAARLARLVAGADPVAAGVIPSSVQVVSLPAIPATTVAKPSSRTPLKALVIGGVIGLLIGIVLLIGWERAAPRIANARMLSELLGCPATSSARLSPEALDALLERWRTLTDHVPARIALIPATRDSVSLGEAILGDLARLQRADVESNQWPATDDGAINSRTSVTLTLTAPPRRGSDGGAELLNVDLAVVVVRAGASLDDVERLNDELGSFGLVPAWALLASARSSRVPAGSHAFAT